MQGEAATSQEAINKSMTSCKTELRCPEVKHYCYSYKLGH